MIPLIQVNGQASSQTAVTPVRISAPSLDSQLDDTIHASVTEVEIILALFQSRGDAAIQPDVVPHEPMDLRQTHTPPVWEGLSQPWMAPGGVWTKPLQPIMVSADPGPNSPT